MAAAVMAKIAPSMLSSDFANLASEADRMLRYGADWLHMDVMDVKKFIRSLIKQVIKPVSKIACTKLALTSQEKNCFKLFRRHAKGESRETFCKETHLIIASLLRRICVDCSGNRHFVPNLTIGAPVIESLRKHTKAYLDCHLMVTNPLDYVEPFAKAGASGFTFHVEVSKDNWQELIHRIKTRGMRAGVALKPGTQIEEVYPLVESSDPVEMVLVMTVEPGFGGQKFMPEMMDKVRTLRKKYPSLDIEVDGGLGPSTIDMAASAGANCIVAGSSVFGAAEPAEAISVLRKSVEAAQQNG